MTGKGPHLFKYNWDFAGTFRLGVNEAALFTPWVSAVIAMDYGVWDNLVEKLVDKSILVLMEQGILRKEYTAAFSNMFRFVTETHVPSGYETAPAGVWLAGLFGVKKIHFVGFDAMSYSRADHARKGSPYDERLRVMDKEKRNHYDYEPINNHIWRALKRFNIEPIWEHTSEMLVNPFVKENT